MNNAFSSQTARVQFRAALGAIGLALLGASQVQAAPSANGAAHAVTGMAHANYHATRNCGDGVLAMTPQPGTELMPLDESGIPSHVDTFYRRAARQHVRWLDVVECEATGITFTSYSGQNWSGYQIGGGSTASNHYVSSGWYVPTMSIPAYPPGNTGEYLLGIWVGLGGGFGGDSIGDDPNRPLIQAGTAQGIQLNGITEYYFWHQIVPGSSYKFKTMTVHPGDDVAAIVFWDQASKSAIFGVCNWNTNICANIRVSKITKTYTDGSSVDLSPIVAEPGNTTEWIVEVPFVGGWPQAAPAFSPVHFYNGAWAATATFSAPTDEISYPLGSPPPSVAGSVNPRPITSGISVSPITMDTTDPSWPMHGIIAYPGGLSPSTYGGSDFYVYYGK